MFFYGRLPPSFAMNNLIVIDNCSRKVVYIANNLGKLIFGGSCSNFAK